MSNIIPFQVFDDAGNPVTGGSFTATTWNGMTGASRISPPIVEITGGYELQNDDDDCSASAVTLVDTGSGNNPRYLLFSVCLANNSNQVLAYLLTDNNGALWTGTGGTLTGWTGGITPSVVKLDDGVFVVRPTINDIDDDASGFIVSPVGAYPSNYALGVEPLGEGGGSPPPVISNVTPAPGLINNTNPLELDVTDEAFSFRQIILVIEFPEQKIKEVAFDGLGFGPMYTNGFNTQTSIVNGYHFELLRDGGWPTGPVVLTPFAIDTTGSENT